MQPKPSTRLKRLAWAIPLLLASLLFWQGFGGTSSAVAPPPLDKASSPLETTPIRDLRTGMRVIGDNPELADQIIEPLQIENPDEWRNVRLEMIKTDDSLLNITLLRSMEWLEFHEASIGSVIELDLAELGAAGPARIITIDPCPDIKPGNRPLITGTFQHTAANVIDLSVENETKPIGTTDNHPFWSQDRQKFVEAGDLKIGEELFLADGRITRVTSIIPRAGPETVYNLEISGEHVYHVGNTGVLVHNTYRASPRTGRLQELRPSRGGTGPNRWHNVLDSRRSLAQQHSQIRSLGQAGSKPNYREIPGTSSDAQRIFDALTRGGTTTRNANGVHVIRMPGNVHVTFRAAGRVPNRATGIAPPTIDINIPHFDHIKLELLP